MLVLPIGSKWGILPSDIACAEKRLLQNEVIVFEPRSTAESIAHAVPLVLWLILGLLVASCGSGGVGITNND